jgi:large subunit ribosomal protein L10
MKVAEKYGKKCKEYMLEDLKKRIKSCPDFVITNCKGLSVSEVQALKRGLKKASSGYFIVKNSILRHVFDQLRMKDLTSFVEGELGMGFIGPDTVAASKAFVDFRKTNKALKIRAAFINGKIEMPEKIERLAALPPKDVLIAMAISRMKGPITGFVGVLSGLLRSCLHVIDEIRKKKEA